jgi:hypothetical protein
MRNALPIRSGEMRDTLVLEKPQLDLGEHDRPPRLSWIREVEQGRDTLYQRSLTLTLLCHCRA